MILKNTTYWTLIYLCFLLGCEKSDHHKEIVDEPITMQSKESISKSDEYDQLIIKHIQDSDNKLIQTARREQEKIEWIMDRTEDTDSARYVVFNIGHEVSDDDSTNVRFVPYCWIYINSLSKDIYEYDVANDVLLEIKNEQK